MHNRIIELQETDSTNNYAKRLLELKRPEEMTVVQTHFQTNGKGQNGNVWESIPRENLMMSIILYPNFLLPSQQFYLLKAISLGITDAVKSILPKVSIKWPNDIYVGNKKMGGVLIEHSIMGKKIDYTIVGIGINVNQDSFSQNLPNPTSIYLERGMEYSIMYLRHLILDAIHVRYNQLKNKQFRKINDDYSSRLYKLGKNSIFMTEDAQFHASLCGVANTGELLLQDDKGSIHAFLHKEIEFVI